MIAPFLNAGEVGKILEGLSEITPGKLHVEIEKLLNALGCSAVQANCGELALEKYIEAQRRGEPFNAVILDLTVPGGMGGKPTMEKLLQIDPHVKAIVASGYSNDPIMANYKDYGFSGVVSKPYKLEELKRVLDQLDM